ncbi:MAG: glycosyltransferase [Bacteroidales bacterium]|nr:glycosyltransferase [Bacteroidales bacterium]HPD95891.1 glycosyltransferase [Tenuifilaceae bacterium]HRX32114.1 glycosyltransferase [Tenuifilaceae bacterium]
MISICIPVYNFDVTDLVDELLRQAAFLNYPVEVLIFDDHSQQYFRQKNALLGSRSSVNYLDFDFNIGRSKIRNRLADFASGQWLLFLDCDVVIDNPNYLKNYIDNLNNTKVICGGRKYGARPFRSEFILRWKYGVQRECKSAFYRQLKPYSAFISGNFIIDYDIFQKVRFNEQLSGYGHEDTLFGVELKKHNVNILHIDNPTVHLGLDPCREFITKTEQGVVNLAKIMRITPCMRKDIERSIKLLKVFHTLRTLGLLPVLRWAFKAMNPVIRQQLCSRNPSILLMDIYKLSLLSQIYRRHWQ